MSSSPHDHAHGRHHDDRTLPPVRLEKVAENVYAFVQPDGSWWINNTGFVAGASTVVAIDSCSTERRTRAFLDAVRSVTDVPVRVLVNTHHHGDHTHGNCFFRPAAVIAHEGCRDEVIATGHLRTTGIFTDIEWGHLDLEPPFVTFTDRLDVHADDLRVELHYVGGPAHTTNDVVAWIPDRGVLFAGDLLFNGGTPFLLMGSISGARRALDRIRSFPAEVVVPGHGDVCGLEITDAAEAYIDFVARTAREGRAAGLSPLELARQTDLGPFRELLDAERIVGNLHRAYAELDGAPPGAPIDLRAAITDMVTYHGRPLRCLA